MLSKFTLRISLLVALFAFGFGANRALAQTDTCPVSLPLVITVHQDPQISITGATTICEGGNADLVATVSNGTGTCTIQWQISADGGVTFTNVGTNSPNYNTGALTQTRIYRAIYGCDGVQCDPDTSNSQTITVNPDPVVAINITDTTICTGGSLTLIATVTGGIGTLTYQWQVSTDDGATWTNVGTNSDTYNTGALTTETYRYKVIISQDGVGCDGTESAPSIITVVDDPAISVAAPDSICVGGSVILTATKSGGTGNCVVQWQQLNGSTWDDIAGSNDDTLHVDNLMASKYYRAIYSCSGLACDPATSNQVQVIVLSDPSVSIAGGEVTICSGGGLTLTANVTGGAGTPSYQWQSSATNNVNDFVDISGATNPTLVITNLLDTTYYRVRVVFSGSGCDPVYSGISTVNVVDDPDAAITGVNPVCVGGDVTMTAVTSGGTGTCTLRWQRWNAGASAWQDLPLPAAGNATYNTGALTTTTIYRIRYSCTGGGCDATFSEPDTVEVIQDPTITVQPDGDVICQGGTLTMEVTATGGTPTLLYQWQYNTGTSGSPVWANVVNGTPAGANYTGATTNSLTVAGIANPGNYEYRVFVDATGSNCDSSFSNPAVIQVEPDPSIDTQPVGGTICVGGQHIMNVVASGGVGGLFYQWQYNNGGTWENVTDGNPAGATYSGADQDNLTVDGITAEGTHPYRVIVTSPGSDCNPDTSVVVNIVVEPALVVATQPIGNEICIDGTHTMTAVITGGSGLTYQWQIRNTTTSAWQNVADGYPTGADYTGETTPSLTVAGVDVAGFYEFQLVTTSLGNNCGSITTDTAGLDVAPPLAVADQPDGAEICEGGTHTMTVSITGGQTLSYQWQIRDGSNNWVNVANGYPTGATYTGANTPSLTAAGITAIGNYEFQVVTSSNGNNCSSITSDTAYLVVSPALAVADQPDGAAICVDGQHVMSATITGGNTLTYQWQIRNTTTSAWQNVADGYPTGATYTGATTNTLTAVGFDNPGNYEYQLVISSTGNSCAAITTDTALVTVVPDPVVTSQPVGDSICVGGNTTLALVASGGTPSLNYQWEYRDNGTWFPVTNGVPAGAVYGGANSNTLTVNGITVPGNHEYRNVITATGNNCDTEISNVVIIHVVTDPLVTVQPLGDTICRGGQHLMTVTATGGTPGLNYQWQYLEGSTWENVSDGNPVGADYTSATPNQLDINGVTEVGSHQFRVVVTSQDGTGCNPDTSDIAILVVNEEISATIAGGGITVCEGGTADLVATQTGGTGNLTYQWEMRVQGGSWTPISGATSLTLTTPALTDTTEFRIVISSNGSGCDDFTSTPVTIYVVPDPVISVAGVTDVCVGGGVLISSTVTGGTGTCVIYWQVSTTPPPAQPVFSDIVPTATGPTYQTPALTNPGPIQYRARIVCDGSGCCN